MVWTTHLDAMKRPWYPNLPAEELILWRALHWPICFVCRPWYDRIYGFSSQNGCRANKCDPDSGPYSKRWRFCKRKFQRFFNIFFKADNLILSLSCYAVKKSIISGLAKGDEDVSAHTSVIPFFATEDLKLAWKAQVFFWRIGLDRYTYLASDPSEADLTSNGVISSVSKKWPRWFVPNCISNPSSVFHSGHIMMP